MEIICPRDGDALSCLEEIRGTGHPCAGVEVSVDGIACQDTVVERSGRWRTGAPYWLAEGEHVVHARMFGPDHCMTEACARFTLCPIYMR